MKTIARLIALIWIVSQLPACKTLQVQWPFCLSRASYVPDLHNPVYEPLTRTLRVSWDTVLCARKYQLEWTFAGKDDTTTTAGSWKPDFRFNSTRITTQALHYNIPLVYEEGTIIYRIRCLNVNDSANQSLFSDWSRVFNGNTTSGINNLRPAASFEVTNALVHEDEKLNWQYSTLYMDEGQRKDMIRYMDGTMRIRQNVSISNSDTLAIAENIIYDNQGRAAINTLPAPVIHLDSVSSSQYARHLGYFAKQVLIARDTAYTYRHFDTDRYAVQSDSCSPPVLVPRTMWIESGVSRYFSPRNGDKNGFQGYIPDAKGYPFIQTQWMDDNTDRVIRKSMPGNMHNIGSNHETSYRYADVAQDEVDMLFGNDAGDERFYSKTIRVDPNGQLSVEYARIDGKVVATALGGPVPDNLDSISQQVVPITVDIVGSEQTIDAGGLSKFSTKTFDLSINTACQFGYRLLPSNFQKALCNNQSVCLDCKYNIRLLLRDDKGNILHQVDTSIGTLLQNCAPGNTPVFRNLFTKVLCKGSYTVTRSIAIDTSGFDNYYQKYVAKADSCSDPATSFAVPGRTISVCNFTCADCELLPDSLKDAYKDYCELICNKGFKSPCDLSKQMMLINLSPGGQYAQFDRVNSNVDASKYPVSIYNGGKWRTLTGTPPALLAVYISNNDLNGMVANWKSEWAEYFLPLHPEYCYYQFCKSTEPAYISTKQFNDGMQDISNARQAITSIYIDPLANDPSLAAFGIFTRVKAKMDNFRNAKPLKEFIYSGFLNCNNVPPYSIANFANTPDTIANNMQWQMFRAIYMSIKNQVIDSVREIYVKSCRGFCNKCIGDSLNYYLPCNGPGCNVPPDSVCTALKKKSKIFSSTFSFQEQLPFKLTGIDSLDLAIIQNYTSTKMPQHCRCAKHEQIESIFHFVVAKKSLAVSINIPDTLCSVGIAYETIPGYKGNLRWNATLQTNGNLDVTLLDTLHNQRCTMNFISVDSLIPWNRIVQLSCLRVNRLPSVFPAGPNIFLVDLYDSSYRKFTAEVKISCIDTGACKPVQQCKRVCDDNGIEEIFNCGFAGGSNTTINLTDSLIKRSVECLYNTKFSSGNLTWKGIQQGQQYIVTLAINAVKAEGRRPKFVDSCRYVFDYGSNIIYAGVKTEVISVEPDRSNSKDTCKIYGVKLILKITVEDQPPRYITVYGRPEGNCFPIVECCKPVIPKPCRNEFSNALTGGNSFPVFNVTTAGTGASPATGSTIVVDTVTALLGINDTLWAKRFLLSNPGYYNFSFTARVNRLSTVPAPIFNAATLQQLLELRLDGSVVTSLLSIQIIGNNVYTIRGRLPIRYKREHRLQVELKAGPAGLQHYRLVAYDFSLTGEMCDDCCLPVFPPFTVPPPDCDSIDLVVDGYNIEIARTQYLAMLREKLKGEFIQHCMSNIDSFRVKYSDALYHFTLFYYDQANNLVQTVPPKGVRLLVPDSIARVQQFRRGQVATAVYPRHTMASRYQFNSINNIRVSYSPDADSVKRWYDPIGRLVFSQRANQKNTGAYNYILYDALNRTYQTGEVVIGAQNPVPLISDPFLLRQTLQARERHDVFSMIFDEPLVDSINGAGSRYRLRGRFFGDTVNYTRSRITARLASDTILANQPLIPLNYDHAAHFWFDQQGYAKMIIHSLPELQSVQQHIKTEHYDYDVLRGKVKKISYQAGQPDQFYTRNVFDADERIRQVETSLNDTVWVKDARYYYYRHGPLARKEIGVDRSLQGVDYIYTIHGWLKMINSDILMPDNDPGQDAVAGGRHAAFKRDVFGYEIGYYEDDYTAIWNVLDAKTFHSVIFDSLFVSKGLYDGNIRFTINALNVPQWPVKRIASIYEYDQLNRLTASNADTVNFYLQPTQFSNQLKVRTRPVDDYKMKIRYDANGNIISMLRNGTAAMGAVAMDALQYNYNAGNNQLNFVRDTVNSLNYPEDIDGQLSNNYRYDASGNLVQDGAAGVDTIIWNSLGKISKVIADGGNTIVNYTYNAFGKRLSKIVNGRVTYYLTGENGNTIATYKSDSSGFRLQNAMIYGVGRIGMFDFTKAAAGQSYLKEYELTDHLGNVLATISDSTGGSGIQITSATDYYPFGQVIPGREFNSSAYRFGYGGHEKDNEIKGNNRFLSFEDYGYDPVIGRRWNPDPETGKIPGISPYSYAYDNPLLLIDSDGELPILPLLIKAGSAGAIDMMIQVAMIYLMDDDVETIEQAFDKVDWVDVSMAAAEGALPWSVPGGKFSKAAGGAVFDVLKNAGKAAYDGKEYSMGDAAKDFFTTFLTSLAGDHLGELLSSKKAKAKVAALLGDKNDVPNIHKTSGGPDVKGISNTTSGPDVDGVSKVSGGSKAAVVKKIVPGPDEGVIYKVSGDKTESGKIYIGSADDMEVRTKTAKDGRDRTGAEIVGTYPKGDKKARRKAEQKAMDDEVKKLGGTPGKDTTELLDNKRNEIADKKRKDYGL